MHALSADLQPSNSSQVLSPAASDWRLVETGRYGYQRSAGLNSSWQETGIVERYARYEDCQSGRQQIRAIRDARDLSDGVLLTVIAHSRGQHLNHLKLSLHDQGGQLRAAVRYDLAPRLLCFSRERLSGSAQRGTLELPVTHHYLPLTRNFLGPVIYSLARQVNGCGAVIVPRLQDPRAADVLSPQLETRQALALQRTTEQLSVGQHRIQAQEYQFLGGPYDQQSRFWVAFESARLLRYHFTSNRGERWACELVELSNLK